MSSTPIHKAGFVNIIGNPNAGKSTLMNVLVGEKLSIITSKVQTTRHRIIGIVNDDNYQIVFSDTPGILEPKYKLHQAMMKHVYSAISDADLILYLVNSMDFIEVENEVINKIKASKIPFFIVLNKTDLINKEKEVELLSTIKSLFPETEVFPISALKAKNTDALLKRIIEMLPECPPYYPKDELTDKNQRFFISEIIREKILLNYQKEIPYSVEIDVESFKESEEIIRIMATIYVMRDTQKGIIIGSKGSLIKKTGTEARIDIEKFLEKKVYLELHVKVRKDWRDNPNNLKRFGYEI